MKKVVVLMAGFALCYAVLGGFNPKQAGWEFDFFSSTDRNENPNYVAKYRDCITLEDFPHGLVMDKRETERVQNGRQEALAEYSRQLGATLRNLNHLEAHNHIHQEFQRSRERLLQPGLKEAQRIFQIQIMNLCYERDKALNLGTSHQL